MPKKKPGMTPEEQSERFKADAQKLIDTGELTPIAADAALDELVRRARDLPNGNGTNKICRQKWPISASFLQLLLLLPIPEQINSGGVGGHVASIPVRLILVERLDLAGVLRVSDHV